MTQAEREAQGRDQAKRLYTQTGPVEINQARIDELQKPVGSVSVLASEEARSYVPTTEYVRFLLDEVRHESVSVGVDDDFEGEELPAAEPGEIKLPDGYGVTVPCDPMIECFALFRPDGRMNWDIGPSPEMVWRSAWLATCNGPDWNEAVKFGKRLEAEGFTVRRVHIVPVEAEKASAME